MFYTKNDNQNYVKYMKITVVRAAAFLKNRSFELWLYI